MNPVVIVRVWAASGLSTSTLKLNAYDDLTFECMRIVNILRIAFVLELKFAQRKSAGLITRRSQEIISFPE